jgi:hypothetical protein
MPLILGANTLAGGGYEIDNSLRFNSGSSDYLNRTPASSTNRKTFTFSQWVKRSDLSNITTIFSTGTNSTTNGFLAFFIDSNGYLRTYIYETNNKEVLTNSRYRDPSAWYHIVLAVDTTQATASNRVKIYVNGSQVTDVSLTNGGYPSQNFDLLVNSTTEQRIGVYKDSGGSLGSYWSGYMSDYFLIDGQALDPTSFGEFDSDTNIWKPIPYTGSFGTNGFYLEFKDSSALGDDTSVNSNDFTVNNLTSIDQTTDTPTNNFATANPLHFNATIPSAGTLSDGNLTFTSSQGASAYPAFYSTIGASQGKWYAEFKVTTANSAIIGIGSGIATGGFLGGGLYDYAYYYDGTFYNNGSNQGTQSSYTDGDIISVAMDLDNNKIYVAKDNVWQHSGDPSAGTGGFVITAPASNNTGTYLIAYGDAGGGTPAIQGNFGNPPFAITTGNADANGYGNFEYAVPPGYYALNTKNLAEYG